MSYIRGALPFLIYNPNTRDDIVPNGSSSSFELSQEVPGGYENNVQVIRREFKSDVLVTSCTSIAFNGSAKRIICSVPSIAAALSIVSVGDILSVQGAADEDNSGEFLVSEVTYDGNEISITVDSGLATEASGASVSLTRRFTGPWEILEPEIDYVIGGVGDQTNKIITFSKVPQETDVIYVVHRGEATYNFVPTEKSVGPEQLQENLRNFKVDLFTGNGSNKDFTLSQFAVNARALEVSINGVIKYGSDSDILFTGDFDLIGDGTVIRFATAPTNGSKIYVRHLGFSTVSRRQSLSPSQIGGVAPGSIGTLQLANNAVTSEKISDGAVTTTKIQDGAVNGAKILLNNNESLNWKSATSPFNPTSVLRLDTANHVTLRSIGGEISLNLADSKIIKVTQTSIRDSSASGQVDLGAASNKFKDAYFSGNVSSGSAEVSGNATVGGSASVGGSLTVTGNLIVSGTVDSVDVSSLQAQVNALAALVAQHNPSGTIKLWAKDTGAPAGYLLCDGASYSTTVYADLFAAIGYTFGGSGGSFSVPDFTGRFPLGKAASGTGSGWGTGPLARGGSLDHIHTTPNHTHGLANHVHSIPSHYHSMVAGNSTLQIATSGGHQTSLQHKHASFSTSSTEGGHTHTIASGNLTISSESGHTHGINSFSITGQGAHSHSFSGATDFRLGQHDHDVIDISTIRPYFTLSDSTAPVDGVNFGAQTITRLSGYGNGYHIYYKPSNTNPGASTSLSPNLSHQHGFSGTIASSGAHDHTIPALGTSSNSGHSHTVSGTIPSTSGSTTHQHTIDIAIFTGNSISDGSHTHSPSNFTGAIGNVATGGNGDLGFNSGPPSPNSTDSGGASTTGASNPAFQTVNFIIKT